MEQLSSGGSLRATDGPFAALAAGGSDPASLDLLGRTRVSRSKLFLARLFAERPDLDDVKEILVAADWENPGAVARLIAYPWTAVWLQRAAAEPRQADVDYGRGLALAAASRAELTGVVSVAPQSGKITVPGLGELRGLGQDERRLTAKDLNGPDWFGLKSVTVSAGGRNLSLTLDDLDPFRQCLSYGVAPHNPDDFVRRTQAVLSSAWELLTAYAPARADELAAGLTVLTPLAANLMAGVSASHQEAYGGFGMSPQTDPAAFAATMIHEFQHSKLSALHALLPLYDPAGNELYFAPWRPDPRPLGGLLQGIYAFLSVAGWWRDLMAAPAEQPRAALQFATLRAQVWRALEQVHDAAGLTEAGRRFVAAVARTAAEHNATPVDAVHDAHARKELQRLESVWHERHA
ncbi:HEXXH motif domain-containing protein [Hamadaea tsunoensis]|uniref:HEXXH motif domain-containing protein n=1 Tax=Hamadaea tsunoensis TaxID=53368 RepID=UPI00041F671E|nr:HEXXH motif domain-containing protein [Hamadaea tsunoensis]